MLDAATISGLIRPVKFTDANRFQQVAFLQENGTLLNTPTAITKARSPGRNSA